MDAHALSSEPVRGRRRAASMRARGASRNCRLPHHSTTEKALLWPRREEGRQLAHSRRLLGQLGGLGRLPRLCRLLLGRLLGVDARPLLRRLHSRAQRGTAGTALADGQRDEAGLCRPPSAMGVRTHINAEAFAQAVHFSRRLGMANASNACWRAPSKEAEPEQARRYKAGAGAVQAPACEPWPAAGGGCAGCGMSAGSCSACRRGGREAGQRLAVR